MASWEGQAGLEQPCGSQGHESRWRLCFSAVCVVDGSEVCAWRARGAQQTLMSAASVALNLCPDATVLCSVT